MSNLDVWLDGVRSVEWRDEIFAKIFSRLVRCNECPASETCRQATDDDYEPDDQEEDCKEHFLKWANQESKE